MGKGKAEGCAACAKLFLIIFNVLFCLIGAALIGTGVYVYVTLSEYLNLFGDPRINGPAIGLLAFGVITFIIAAIGCIGACKENSCLLFTFAGIIGVLLVAEIAIGVVGFVYRGQVHEFLSDKPTDALLKKYNTSAGKDLWDNAQSNLDCCGVYGTDDWTNASLPVPSTCGSNYTIGCLPKIVQLAEDNIYYVGGVGIGFGVIQLLGVVLACCVGCQARKGAAYA